jgi:hypothetical protein
MPQNISVVIIDSDTDLIKKVFKHRGRKLSLRVNLRGEGETNSEIPCFARKKLRDLAFARDCHGRNDLAMTDKNNEIASPESIRIAMTVRI